MHGCAVFIGSGADAQIVVKGKVKDTWPPKLRRVSTHVFCRLDGRLTKRGNYRDIRSSGPPTRTYCPKRQPACLNGSAGCVFQPQLKYCVFQLHVSQKGKFPDELHDGYNSLCLYSIPILHRFC